MITSMHIYGALERNSDGRQARRSSEEPEKKKFPLLLVFPPSLSHNPSAPHVHRFTFALIVETLGFDIKLRISDFPDFPNCKLFESASLWNHLVIVGPFTC